MTIHRQETFTPIQSVLTSPYQASAGETVLVSTSIGDVTVLAPGPTGQAQDMKFRVKKISVDANIVIIDASAGFTIETPLNIASSSQIVFLVGAEGAVAEWQYREITQTWICTNSSKMAVWQEVWQATTIVDVGLSSTIEWAFLESFPGQTPLIASHSSGLFTFISDGSFNISIDVVIDFISSANNTEAQVRLVDNFTSQPARNEQQTVSITGTVTAGTFTLRFAGQETAPINWNATAAQVGSAIEALLLVEVGDILPTGGPLPGTPVVCEFQGNYDNRNVEEMFPDGSLLTGTDPDAVVTTTQGGRNGTGTQLLLDYISSFQSTRSGTFGFSGNTGGKTSPEVGDTTSFDIGEDFATNMTIDLISGLLIFDTG